MVAPTLTVTNPQGHITHVDFTASQRYRSPTHPPWPASNHLRATKKKTRLHYRKPPQLELCLFNVHLPPHKWTLDKPVYCPLSQIDMKQFRGKCTCPRDTFCHICFLTAQEMVSELSLYPVTADGRCKCARGLPGSFCDACYTDFDSWTRRLKEAAADIQQELLLSLPANPPSTTEEAADKHQELLLPANTPSNAEGTEVGVPTEQAQTDAPVPQESPFGQGLYSQWDDLEVAGMMQENAGSEPTTGTETAGSEQTPQPEKKVPFWKRIGPKPRALGALLRVRHGSTLIKRFRVIGKGRSRKRLSRIDKS
ncbi:hypothetical protein CONLIGDRAFT_508545 [Coniochaeta ligniaria NRRL 30616]|uniref:Uncharacterized protein n=1 Tax=Coniochaeta ligniaria NRRL 30616 TaxID=1408157 RepID=A0A1J7IXQ0_9PEZI|nr:hypothetical protein CONLIGDRAFT_508545 [Coniochaeta ligniaria NRRL 30616]